MPTVYLTTAEKKHSQKVITNRIHRNDAVVKVGTLAYKKDILHHRNKIAY